jgi:glycosyltransferase involved in cell wall biosynthesis
MTDDLIQSNEPGESQVAILPEFESPELAEPVHSNGIRKSASRGATDVLHLINGEHYSGAERVQDLLALGLPQWNFRVAFACVKPGKFLHTRKSRQTPLFSIEMKRKWDLNAVFQLQALIRKNDYSIIHAHTPRTALLGAILSRWCKLPLVYHVHSPVGRDSTHRLRNIVNQWVETYSLSSATHLITVSNSLASYMSSLGISDKKLTVVPNGVPVELSGRSSESPSSPWKFGTVALFRQRKGTEVLIDALKILRDRGIRAELLAVGGFETPEYEAFLKHRVREHKLDEQVRWTGFTPDVGSELTKFDAFVLPSLFGEGLPMVVLEAMAAGVPVIGTRVEGVPEIIQHGKEGLLANPADPHDLASRMQELIEGTFHWHQLRANAKQRHASQFSDVAMCHGVASVYEKVLAGN